MPGLADPRGTKMALALARLQAKKTRDQHFLVDEIVLGQIVAAANLQKSDTVLEIGPGLGTLTTELVASVAKVIAVELDNELADLLRKTPPKNLEVIEQDFRQFDLSKLPTHYKVVANLPYSITSLVFERLLSTRTRPQSITVLVQKEVAERICAPAGKMSLLSLSIQYYAEPSIISLVPPTSFYPAPRVDSAVLHIVVQPKPVFEADEAKLFRLWRMSFAARRKKLKNNLNAGMALSNEDIIMIFTQAELDLNVRAQELSLSQWEKLYSGLEPKL